MAASDSWLCGKYIGLIEQIGLEELVCLKEATLNGIFTKEEETININVFSLGPLADKLFYALEKSRTCSTNFFSLGIIHLTFLTFPRLYYRFIF